MTDIPLPIQIESAESSNCIELPKDPPLDPIIDSLRESVFFPKIRAYVTADARIRESGEFGVEMNLMYGTRTSGMEIYFNRYTDIKEGLDYLKKLSRITVNLIEFIEKNNLKQIDD